MTNYEETIVTLTNTQLNKVKIEVKNKSGTSLSMTKKNFKDQELLNELFLTTRQSIKIRNTFTNNIWTDIKLSKSQISKIIQWGGFFGSWLNELGKKIETNLSLCFARDKLPRLVNNITSNAAWNAINKFERKISGKEAVRAGKGFTLSSSNEDIDDIITIIKLLEASEVLIEGITEAVKHKIEKQERGFLAVLLASSVASVV